LLVCARVQASHSLTHSHSSLSVSVSVLLCAPLSKAVFLSRFPIWPLSPSSNTVSLLLFRSFSRDSDPHTIKINFISFIRCLSVSLSVLCLPVCILPILHNVYFLPVGSQCHTTKHPLTLTPCLPVCILPILHNVYFLPVGSQCHTTKHTLTLTPSLSACASSVCYCKANERAKQRIVWRHKTHTNPHKPPLHTKHSTHHTRHGLFSRSLLYMTFCGSLAL